MPENALDRSTLEAICEFVGNDRTVLNFIADRQRLDEMLAARGCSVVAVTAESQTEISNERRSDLVQFDGDFGSVRETFADRQFDVVLVGDIVERLHDPWNFFSEARSIIGPQGSMVVALRNSSHGAIQLSESIGEFDYTNFGLLGGSRLRFFSRSLIEQLFIRSGYHIEELERIRLPLFTSSPALPPVRESEFDAALIERIRSDEDHETLVFVARARPLDDVAARIQLDREFAAVANRAERLNEETIERSIEVRMTADELRSASAEKDTALARAIALQLRIEHLENLHTRAFDAAHEAENTISDLRAINQKIEHERDTTARALNALAERFDVLSAESVAVETYCRRLSASFQDARSRTFAAEKALFEQTRPFADERGLIEDVRKTLAIATAWRERSQLLLHQLDSLEARLERSEEQTRKTTTPVPGKGFSFLRKPRS